jgi:hypothetical protein
MLVRANEMKSANVKLQTIREGAFATQREQPREDVNTHGSKSTAAVHHEAARAADGPLLRFGRKREITSRRDAA